jgi:ribonuclease HII
LITQYKPTFNEEKELLSQGFCFIAGVDEAGRGCLAGPVVAAAVIFPCKVKGGWIKQVRDSKLLSANEREYLFGFIKEASVAFAVGTVSHAVIDEINILEATKLAMKQAIEQLEPQPDTLLIDFLKLPDIPVPQKGIVHGDGLCFSIACASIIAKVSRDRMMEELDKKYPGYGLCKHKGYCTEEHVYNLNRLGPSPIHRHSFEPVKRMCQP